MNGLAGLQYHGFFAEFATLKERVTQLEKHIHYPHNETAMKEAAAKAQAQQEPLGSYGKMQATADQPLLNDVKAIRELGALARRLLNPEDFGHAVTFEVRQAARRALGLPEVKEYDL